MTPKESIISISNRITTNEMKVIRGLINSKKGFRIMNCDLGKDLGLFIRVATMIFFYNVYLLDLKSDDESRKSLKECRFISIYNEIFNRETEFLNFCAKIKTENLILDEEGIKEFIDHKIFQASVCLYLDLLSIFRIAQNILIENKSFAEKYIKNESDFQHFTVMYDLIMPQVTELKKKYDLNLDDDEVIIID